MWVYDFEVFKYDWLVVIKQFAASQRFEFVNDPEGLREFYEAHKEDLWIGFNNKKYDDYILKTILSGGNPKQVNDIIIVEQDFPKLFNMYDFFKYPLYSYDVSQDAMRGSLKEFEGYLGLNIEESAVRFDIDRRLEPDEVKDVLFYCRHDVDATEYLAEKRIKNLQTKLELVRKFKLTKNDLKKTNAQLAAKILGATSVQKYDDEFSPYEPPETLQLEHDELLTFYQTIDYSQELVVPIAGVDHIFRYGGLHGARPHYFYTGEMWMLDVSSYYPSMMVYYDFLSRSIPLDNRQFFKDMYHERLRMKAEGNSKEAAIYKLILNTVFGVLKSEFNGLYDPKQANNICITGQLLLVDLIEKIEPYCTVVQSNTDGILVIPHKKDRIRFIVKEWEERTHMPMDIEVATGIYQKDVNNYIMVFEDGNIKLKGGMVYQSNLGKESNSNLRQSGAILDDCVVNYFVNGVTPEQTVAECDDMLRYQIITKTGKTFFNTIWDNNGDKDVNKVNRVYASKDTSKGKLYKLKDIDGRVHRHAMPNVPDHCVVDNRNGVTIDEVDKAWYVEQAWDRIKQYKGER